MIFQSLEYSGRFFPIIGKLAAALCLGLPAAGRAASNELRVMSFNLRYASASADQGTWKQWDNPNYSPQRRACVVRLFTNRAPDIAGFQEGEQAQMEYLDAHLPAQYALEWQRPSGGSGAENAAIAWNTQRLELLDRGVFSLGPSPGGSCWNNPPGTNFNPWLYFPDMGMAFPRITLWGRFRWLATGQEFYFYTTHFDFNNTPQVASATMICEDARARARLCPLSPLAIVVGDFNSSQNNNDWKLFTGAFTNNGVTGDFTDSWYQVKGTWTASGTFHGFAGGTPAASERIDWILHRGGFMATQCVVVTDFVRATNLTTLATTNLYPSDHYPVYADLRLPPSPSDYDRDGLPDAAELLATNTLAGDPDTDNDLLLDGQEDLDGDGQPDGGESDPAHTADTQLPTDIRHFMMDGVLDQRAGLGAENNGMQLYWRFDGRHLYVATWDAGEGNDHFIFVVRNPADTTAAPWAKAGQVARWDAQLADENDSDFTGWFDSNRALITDLTLARAATYFENGGRLEGVIDLSRLYGAGFTNVFYLAVAPYGNGDGGALQAAWQVPAGNGDGDLAGASEFLRIDPGDMDRDGINDYADPDLDGDGLPNAWESAYGLNPSNATAQFGMAGDPDGDGASNRDEFLSCTHPQDDGSCFEMAATAAGLFTWTIPGGKSSQVQRATATSYPPSPSWATAATLAAGPDALIQTNTWPPAVSNAVYRLQLFP